jgi:hypothetical protein
LGDLDRSISEYLAKDGDALGANVTYQVGNGFTFATQDGRFALTIGGFFQFWYQGYDRDRNPFGCCDGYDEMYYGGGLDRRDVNQFDMDFRWHFQGHAFDPNLTYYFEFAIDYEGWVGLYEGYVDYNVCDWFNVRAGQQRLPLGRQALVHETDLSFGNRAFEGVNDYNLNNGFTVGSDEGMDYGVYRDLGVMIYKMYEDLFDVKVMGDEGMAFEYMIGIWNGELAQDNNWMAMALRWAYYPFGAIPYVESDWTSSANPKFGIGMSFASDQGTPGGNERMQFYGWDAVMTWSGLYLTGEWQRTKFVNYDGNNGDNGKIRQWFVEAGFMVLPQELELMIRYVKQGAGAGVDPSKTEEWSGGVAYYFEGHNLKGILEVGQQQTDSPSGSDLKDAEAFFFRLTFQLEW